MFLRIEKEREEGCWESISGLFYIILMILAMPCLLKICKGAHFFFFFWEYFNIRNRFPILFVMQKKKLNILYAMEEASKESWQIQFLE